MIDVFKLGSSNVTMDLIRRLLDTKVIKYVTTVGMCVDFMSYVGAYNNVNSMKYLKVGVIPILNDIDQLKIMIERNREIRKELEIELEQLENDSVVVEVSDSE